MTLYRCKVIRHLEESIHENLPENVVRSLRNPELSCLLGPTHLIGMERKEAARCSQSVSLWRGSLGRAATECPPAPAAQGRMDKL